MKLRSALAVVTLAAASLVVGPAPAHALDGTLLPFNDLTDVQVDDAHGRVFLSGDGSLVSTDLAGHLTSDPSVSEIDRIAWSPDGAELVVTRSTYGSLDGRISLLDPATRSITKTLTLPAGCAVGDVAPASGKVFFYSYCNGDDAWSIGAVDLASGVTTLRLQTPVIGYNGTLYSVPGQPSMLVTWINNQVIVYDTTGGMTPTLTVRASRPLQPNDLVLTPDGSQLVVSRTGSETLLAYSTTDLAQVGEYYASGSTALAVRADGVVAAGGYQNMSYFKAGTFEPNQVHRLPSSYGLSPGSLAFGAKRLYEVTRVDTRLRLVVDTPGPPAALKIGTGATTYDYGSAPSLSVALTSPTTNRTVQIYATPYGGTKKLVKTVVVPASGQTTALMPKVTISSTYTAQFEGDEDFAASSATTAVKVRGRITISTPSTSMSSYFHKVTASPVRNLTVTALPVRVSCLNIALERYSSVGWKGVATVRCPQVSSTGTWVDPLSGQHRGDRIRVRVYTGSNPLSAATSTTWYYILFT